MSTRIREFGTIVNGRYYPPGVKPPTEGIFAKGRYYPAGWSPRYQQFQDIICGRTTKSGLFAVPGIATEEEPEPTELEPFVKVAERIVKGRRGRQCSISLPDLCKTIRLNDFTSEELEKLLVKIGLSPSTGAAMLRVCELFGPQILADKVAIAELRGRLPVCSLVHVTKSTKLFTNDQVHGYNATWTDAATGVEKVRFLKITTCDWEEEFVYMIREAVIQAYLAHRFPGKFPEMHAIYQTNYTRRPGTALTPHFVFEMEYIVGGSLHDAIYKGILNPDQPVGGARRPVTLADLMRIAHSVCEMLVEIQGATGFVHNDLHTGNICITADGRVVFIDCGHNTLFSDSEGAGVPKVMGGIVPHFYFPAYLCPTIRSRLSPAAQGAAGKLVTALWRKILFDSIISKHYYPLDLARQADPDVNPYMRSGDIFYFLYNILADLDRCRKAPRTRADYEGMYKALLGVFQFDSHPNIFEVIRELELTGEYNFIAYFASKDTEVLSAIFPSIPSVLPAMISFRPENMRHTLKRKAAVCGIHL